jgi:hypothetical protein
MVNHNPNLKRFKVTVTYTKSRGKTFIPCTGEIDTKSIVESYNSVSNVKSCSYTEISYDEYNKLCNSCYN